MKIIKITQTNCKPCKSLGMFLDTIGVELDEEWNLDTIEMKEDSEILNDLNVMSRKDFIIDELDIMSTPAMLAFNDDNEVVDTLFGVDYQKVHDFLVKHGRIVE